MPVCAVVQPLTVNGQTVTNSDGSTATGVELQTNVAPASCTGYLMVSPQDWQTATTIDPATVVTLYTTGLVPALFLYWVAHNGGAIARAIRSL